MRDATGGRDSGHLHISRSETHSGVVVSVLRCRHEVDSATPGHANYETTAKLNADLLQGI